MKLRNKVLVNAKKSLKLIDIVTDKDILGLAASIAYYTVLSMTPFLLLFFGFLAFVGYKDIPEINERIADVIGSSQVLVLNSIKAKLETDEGAFAFGVFGLITLLFSASAVITQIQTSLNLIFGLPDDKRDTGFVIWLRNKIFSIFSLFFCVIIAASSLVLSFAVRFLLPFEDQNFWNLVNISGSYLVFTLIFTLMFRFLPFAQPSWKFSFKSALVCSLLFHLGRGVIEIYFAHAGLESSYGALSSFIIFLLWAYYNAVMILVSASIAQVYFAEKVELSP